MRSSLTFLALMLWSMATAAAQPAAAPPARRGVVLAGENGDAVAGVHLAKLDVKSIVSGATAQTAVTLTFSNDQIRVLGGTLTFPLPENATVTGYALDV